jgi:hypothetical protein
MLDQRRINMHGFPAEFDARVLVAMRVDALTRCEFTFWLDFEENADPRGRATPLDRVRIQVYGEFSHALVGELLARVSASALDINLATLVGRIVQAVDVDPSSTLTLRFDDGQTFACHDDPAQLECYAIEYRGVTHYV